MSKKYLSWYFRILFHESVISLSLQEEIRVGRQGNGDAAKTTPATARRQFGPNNAHQEAT